jgi:predicted nucleic acid-binding protein
MAGLRGRVGGTLVLDAEGLVKLASGDLQSRNLFETIRRRRGRIVTAASTLTEVLRGVPADAGVHRVLRRITVISIDQQHGRAAGELLGRCGLSGHRCALDALLAVVALGQPRPVVVLTSDPGDLGRLTEEPEIRKSQRVQVIRI